MLCCKLITSFFSNKYIARDFCTRSFTNRSFIKDTKLIIIVNIHFENLI
jgi:hypothetical protein